VLGVWISVLRPESASPYFKSLWLERLPEFISDWQPIGHAAGRRPALPERASVRRSSLGSWFGRKLFLAIAIDLEVHPDPEISLQGLVKVGNLRNRQTSRGEGYFNMGICFDVNASG